MRKCFLSQINIRLPYNYKGTSSIAVVQPKPSDGLAIPHSNPTIAELSFLVALITLYKCVCGLVVI